MKYPATWLSEIVEDIGHPCYSKKGASVFREQEKCGDWESGSNMGAHVSEYATVL